MENRAELIEESLDGSERVRKIEQNLKSFSQLNQGGNRGGEQATDVKSVWRVLIAIVWNEIKDKSQLVTNFGELPGLRCNAAELTQVFTNILVNAAQEVERDGLINLGSSCDGENIIITIEDNGCGISAESLSRILEPFFITKEVGKGTGLGMSISYEIVKTHGGDLQIQSVVGEGNFFYLIFPLQRDPANPPGSAKE